MMRTVNMRRRIAGRSAWVLLLALAATTMRSSAADPPAEQAKKSFVPPSPKGYVCYQRTRPIRIDGRLDEKDWESAPWTDDFVDIEGDVRPRPRFRTRARML